MRRSIALLTALSSLFSSVAVDACCLTDRLYGRPATPYVVGYAPVTTTTYAPPAPAYVAGYAPATTSALIPPTTVTPAPNGTGAVALQRPTYFDNPSVYTGMPVVGNAVPVYRNPVSVNRYAVGYAPAQVPLTSPGGPVPITMPAGTPMSAVPPTSVAPIYAQPAPPPQPSGLSRFFGSFVGTNYRTTYYRAPVTYYRPVTTVNPATGTTVTTQLPCTGTEQMVQRIPYSNFQVPKHAPPPPAATCATPSYPPPAYGCPPGTTVAPMTTVTPGVIGQTGAIGSGAAPAAPIPSTAPTTLPTSPPAPVPGIPPGPMAPVGQGAPAPGGDTAPVPQPQLQNRVPINGSIAPPPIAPTTSPPASSSWRLQHPQDSTAMIRPSYGNTSAPLPATQANNSAAPLTSRDLVAQPIQAPDDYVSPYQRDANRRPQFGTPTFQQPASPPATQAPLPTNSSITPDSSGDADRFARRAAVSGHSASTRSVDHRTSAPVTRRDSTWYPISQ